MLSRHLLLPPCEAALRRCSGRVLHITQLARVSSPRHSQESNDNCLGNSPHGEEKDGERDMDVESSNGLHNANDYNNGVRIYYKTSANRSSDIVHSLRRHYTTKVNIPFGISKSVLDSTRSRLRNALRPLVPSIWTSYNRALNKTGPLWEGLDLPKGFGRQSKLKYGGGRIAKPLPPARRKGYFHDPNYHLSPSQRKRLARRLRRNPFATTRRNQFQWSHINFSPEWYISPKSYAKSRAQPHKPKLILHSDQYTKIPSLSRTARSFARHIKLDDPKFGLAGPLRELLERPRYITAWKLKPDIALARFLEIKRHKNNAGGQYGPYEQDAETISPTVDPEQLALLESRQFELGAFLPPAVSETNVNLSKQVDDVLYNSKIEAAEDDVFPSIRRGYMHAKKRYMRSRRRLQRQWSRILSDVDPLEKVRFRKWLLKQDDQNIAQWLVDAGISSKPNPILTGDKTTRAGLDTGSSSAAQPLNVLLNEDTSAENDSGTLNEAKKLARESALRKLNNMLDTPLSSAPQLDYAMETESDKLVEVQDASASEFVQVSDEVKTPTIHEREANLLPESRQRTLVRSQHEKQLLTKLGHKDLLNDMDHERHYDICESFWIFSEGAMFFEQMWRDIDEAQCEVFFETYNYIYGAMAEITLKKLKAAALRGVNVIMLFNAFVFRATIPSDLYHLQQCGVKLLWYNRTDPSSKTWLHRNHRKLVVIDGGVAYLGGKNITDGARFAASEFFSDEYIDMMVRIEGAAAIEIRANFNDHIRTGLIDDPWAEAPRVPPCYFVPTDTDQNGMRWGYIEYLSAKDYRKLNGIVEARTDEIFDDMDLEMHERIFEDTKTESALLNDLRNLDYDVDDNIAVLRWLNEPYPLPATAEDSSEISQQFAVLEVPQSHFELPRVYTHVYPERQMQDYVRARQLLQRSVPTRAFPLENSESRRDSVERQLSLSPIPNIRTLAWWDDPQVGNVMSHPSTAEGLTEAARQPSMAAAGIKNLTQEEARDIIKEASRMKDVLPETHDPAVVSKIMKTQLAEFPDMTTEIWNNVPISIFEINDMAGVSEFQEILCQMLDDVESNLTIVNPYFSPPHWLLNVLRRIDAKGVQTTIIVSGRGQPISEVGPSTQRFLQMVGLKNVSIRVLDDPSHVKMWIFDDHTVVFGSMNFDSLSLNNNAEIGIIVQDPNVVNTMIRWAIDTISSTRPNDETPPVSEAYVHVAHLVNYYLLTAYTSNRSFEANEEGQMKLHDWLYRMPWLRPWIYPWIEFSRNHMMLDHGFTFQHMVNLYGGSPTIRPIIHPKMPSIGRIWRNIDMMEKNIPWRFATILYRLQRIYRLRRWAKTGICDEPKTYLAPSYTTSFSTLMSKLLYGNSTIDKASLMASHKTEESSKEESLRNVAPSSQKTKWQLIKDWLHGLRESLTEPYLAMELKQLRRRSLCTLRPFRPFRGLKSRQSINVLPWKRRGRNAKRGAFLLPGERISDWMERRRWWMKRDIALTSQIRSRMLLRKQAKQVIVGFQRHQYEKMATAIQQFRKSNNLEELDLPRFARPDHTMIESIIIQSASDVFNDGKPYLERLALFPPFTKLTLAVNSTQDEIIGGHTGHLNSQCREIVSATDRLTRLMVRATNDPWESGPIDTAKYPAGILHSLTHSSYPSFVSNSSTAHSPSFSKHNIDESSFSRAAALVDQNQSALGITVEPIWSKPTLSSGSLAAYNQLDSSWDIGQRKLTAFEAIQTIVAPSRDSKQRSINDRVLRAELAARKVRASISKLHWLIMRQCKHGRQSVFASKAKRGHWNPSFFRYRERLLQKADETRTDRARTLNNLFRKMLDFSKRPDPVESGEVPYLRGGRVHGRRRYPVPSIAELLRMMNDPIITDHQYYFLVRLGMKRVYKSILYCMRILFRLRGSRAKQDFVYNAMLQAAEEGRDLIAVTRAALRVKGIPEEPLEQNAPATPYPVKTLAGMKLRQDVRKKERRNRPWYATLAKSLTTSKGWQYLVARGWLSPPDSFGEVRAVNPPIYTTAHASGREGAFHYIRGGGLVTNRYLYPFKDEVDQMHLLHTVNTISSEQGGVASPYDISYLSRISETIMFKLVRGTIAATRRWKMARKNKEERSNARLDEWLDTLEQRYSKEFRSQLKFKNDLTKLRIQELKQIARYALPTPERKRDQETRKLFRVPIPPSLIPPATRISVRPDGLLQHQDQEKRKRKIQKRQVEIVPWILPRKRGCERKPYSPGMNMVFFRISRRARLYNEALSSSILKFDVDSDEGTRPMLGSMKSDIGGSVSRETDLRKIRDTLASKINDFDSAVVDSRLINPYRLISPQDDIEAETILQFFANDIWRKKNRFYWSEAPELPYDAPFQQAERWPLTPEPKQILEMKKFEPNQPKITQLVKTPVFADEIKPGQSDFEAGQELVESEIISQDEFERKVEDRKKQKLQSHGANSTTSLPFIEKVKLHVANNATPSQILLDDGAITTSMGSRGRIRSWIKRSFRVFRESSQVPINNNGIQEAEIVGVNTESNLHGNGAITASSISSPSIARATDSEYPLIMNSPKSRTLKLLSTSRFFRSTLKIPRARRNSFEASSKLYADVVVKRLEGLLELKVRVIPVPALPNTRTVSISVTSKGHGRWIVKEIPHALPLWQSTRRAVKRIAAQTVSNVKKARLAASEAASTASAVLKNKSRRKFVAQHMMKKGKVLTLYATNKVMLSSPTRFMNVLSKTTERVRNSAKRRIYFENTQSHFVKQRVVRLRVLAKERFNDVRKVVSIRRPVLSQKAQTRTQEMSSRLKNMAGSVQRARAKFPQFKSPRFTPLQSERKSLRDKNGLDPDVFKPNSETNYMHDNIKHLLPETKTGETLMITSELKKSTDSSHNALALFFDRKLRNISTGLQDKESQLQIAEMKPHPAHLMEDEAPGFFGWLQYLLGRYDPQRWRREGEPESPPRAGDDVDRSKLPERMRDSPYRISEALMKARWPKSRLQILLERRSQRREVDEERIIARQNFATRLRSLLVNYRRLILSRSTLNVYEENLVAMNEYELERRVREIVDRCIPPPIYFSRIASAPDSGYHSNHNPSLTLAQEIKLLKEAERMIERGERILSGSTFSSLAPEEEFNADSLSSSRSSSPSSSAASKAISALMKTKPGTSIDPARAVAVMNESIAQAIKISLNLDPSNYLRRKRWRPDYEFKLLRIPFDRPGKTHIPEHFLLKQLPSSTTNAIFADDMITSEIHDESARLRREEESNRVIDLVNYEFSRRSIEHSSSKVLKQPSIELTRNATEELVGELLDAKQNQQLGSGILSPNSRYGEKLARFDRLAKLPFYLTNKFDNRNDQKNKYEELAIRLSALPKFSAWFKQRLQNKIGEEFHIQFDGGALYELLHVAVDENGLLRSPSGVPLSEQNSLSRKWLHERLWTLALSLHLDADPEINDALRQSDVKLKAETSENTKVEGDLAKLRPKYKIHGSCRPILHSLNVAMQRFCKHRVSSVKALDVNAKLDDPKYRKILLDAAKRESLRILRLKAQRKLSEEVGFIVK